MALQSGTRLGPYEIVSALGAGGMGEVYRARDTRLQRIVAVKVLAPSLAADADFVQGIRLALATAVGLLAIVLAAGIVWFPRHKEAIADAEHEATKLEKEEEGGRVEM